MIICAADIVCATPLTVYILCQNAGRLSPWISWEDTHFDFNKVYVFPASVWQQPEKGGPIWEMVRWLLPFSAFVFFFTIGLAKEARNNYRRVVDSALSLFGTRLPGSRMICPTEIDTVRTVVDYPSDPGRISMYVLEGQYFYYSATNLPLHSGSSIELGKPTNTTRNHISIVFDQYMAKPSYNLSVSPELPTYYSVSQSVSKE